MREEERGGHVIRRCAAPPFFKDKAVDARGEVAAKRNTRAKGVLITSFNIFVISDALFCILVLTMLFKKIKPR